MAGVDASIDKAENHETVIHVRYSDKRDVLLSGAEKEGIWTESRGTASSWQFMWSCAIVAICSKNKAVRCREDGAVFVPYDCRALHISKSYWRI